MSNERKPGPFWNRCYGDVPDPSGPPYAECELERGHDGEHWEQPEPPAAVTLGAAWAEAEAALPEGFYISNVRSRSPGGRWAAAATLHGSDTGANYSGFGPTPAAALQALAAKFRDVR